MATEVALNEEKLSAFEPAYSSRVDLMNVVDESKLISTEESPHKLSTRRTSTDDEEESDDNEMANEDDNEEVAPNPNRPNSYDEFVKMSSIYSNNDIKAPATSSSSQMSRSPVTPTHAPALTEAFNDADANADTATEAKPNLFDDVDFKDTPKDMPGKVAKFIKAFEYICHVKDGAKIVDDQKCYEAFFYIKSLLSQDERFIENKNWKFLAKTNMDQILVIFLSANVFFL